MYIYKSHELQLLSPCAAATETCVPRAHALQQEKPYNEKLTHCNKDPEQQKLRKKNASYNWCGVERVIQVSLSKLFFHWRLQTAPPILLSDRFFFDWWCFLTN